MTPDAHTANMFVVGSAFGAVSYAITDWLLDQMSAWLRRRKEKP